MEDADTQAEGDNQEQVNKRFRSGNGDTVQNVRFVRHDQDYRRSSNFRQPGERGSHFNQRGGRWNNNNQNNYRGRGHNNYGNRGNNAGDSKPFKPKGKKADVQENIIN